MKKIFSILFLGWLVFPFSAGMAQAASALNGETLKGLWESIREKEMRVIRVDIRSDQEAYLDIAQHPKGYGAYHLKEMKIQGNRLQMSFANQNGQQTAQLEGTVLLLEGGGVLKGKLTLEPDPEKQSTPELEFLKLPKDYKDEIEPKFNVPKDKPVEAKTGEAKKESLDQSGSGKPS